MNLPLRVQSTKQTIPPPTRPTLVPSNISFKLFLHSLSLTTSLAFFLVFFFFFKFSLFLSPYLAMVEVFTAMGIGYDSGVALLPLSVQLLLQIIQF